MRNSNQLYIWILTLAVWNAWGGLEAEAWQEDPSSMENLTERLEAAEARIRLLEATAPEEAFGHSSESDVSQASFQGEEINAQAPLYTTKSPDFETGYNKGFFIQPVDPKKNPFLIKVGGRMQFRHTAFARDVTEWTDNAGVTRPVEPRNDFEIERARLTFEGFFIDPKLEYYINIDADTDDNHQAIFHDFWINYEFSKEFNLYVGKAFVPGSRAWLDGSTRTRFADRSLATTFFRPDRSIGIWATGEFAEDKFYRVMISNGFATTDLAPADIDNTFTYSGTSWWDIWGDYGSGYSDLEHHDTLAMRVGHSFTYSPEQGKNAVGLPLAEEAFARLSDGTRLTDNGALAPGVRVDHFQTYLYAIDMGAKFCGFSFNGEYYFRWLQDIQGNGTLPISQTFDHGFYLESGYFLIPKKLEMVSRTSQIYGDFGDAAEYATGVNWFIKGHNLKVTFDLTKIVQSPVNSSSPNYRTGDDGLMARTQFQAAF